MISDNLIVNSPMNNRKIDCPHFIILVLTFGLAVFVHLWVTKAGIGIQGDASPYILTARSLRDGQGFYILDKPMAIWAPLYPLLLAMVSYLGSTIESTARYMHALIYGMNSVLFVTLIYSNTRRNISAAVIGALFFLSSGAILFVHSIAWSESPFLLFILTSCIFLHHYCCSNRFRYLTFFSLSIGMAIAIRYVGVSLIPPAALIILFMLKRPLYFRIKAAAGMVAIAITPILIWTIRNQLVVGSLTDRTLVYHPRGIAVLVRSFADVFHGFILSDPGSTILQYSELVLIALILAVITIILIKNRKAIIESDNSSVITVMFGVLFMISYIAVLLITIIFLDAAVPVNNRLLFPVLVLAALTVIILVYLFSRVVSKRAIWSIFLLCVIFSIRSNAPSALKQAKNMHDNGIGFNSYHWQNSTLKSLLITKKPTSKIYSNGYNIIQILTGIKAYTLPEKYFNNTQFRNLNFEQEIQVMCQEVKSGKAAVIYVEQVSKKNLPEEEQLLEMCELPVLISTGDAIIYGYNLNGFP